MTGGVYFGGGMVIDSPIDSESYNGAVLFRLQPNLQGSLFRLSDRLYWLNRVA